MGPFEKEVDELMQRGALGAPMVLEAAVHGTQSFDMSALEQSLKLLIDLIGVQRTAILRVAREIDDLRASDSIGDE